MQFLLAYFILSLPFIQCIYPHHLLVETIPPELALDYTAPTIPPPLPTTNNADYNFEIILSETDTDSEQDTDYPYINFNRMELPKTENVILDRYSADPWSTDPNFISGEILSDTSDSMSEDLPESTESKTVEHKESTQLGQSSSSKNRVGGKRHVLRKKMKKKN